MGDDEQQRRHQGQLGHRGMARVAKRASGPDADEHEPEDVNGGVGEQSFDVGARRGVQRPVERRERAERDDGDPPPYGSPVQQVVADPDDAVYAHRDHRTGHHRRNRARRLGMRFGQPNVKRHGPRLRGKSQEHQHERGGANYRRERVRVGLDLSERLAAASKGEQQESQENRRRPELGHDAVPQRSVAGFSTMTMFDHDEQHRADGHQLPKKHQRGNAGGRGHGQQ